MKGKNSLTIAAYIVYMHRKKVYMNYFLFNMRYVAI